MDAGAAGQSGNRKWKRYDIRLDTGEVYGTFSKTVAREAYELMKLGEPVKLNLSWKGGRCKVESVEAVEE